MYQLRLLECWHKKSIPQILVKNRPDAAYAIAKVIIVLKQYRLYHSVKVKNPNSL